MGMKKSEGGGERKKRKKCGKPKKKTWRVDG